MRHFRGGEMHGCEHPTRARPLGRVATQWMVAAAWVSSAVGLAASCQLDPPHIGGRSALLAALVLALPGVGLCLMREHSTRSGRGM